MSGWAAILFGIGGKFITGSLFLFAAVIFDSLDGRAARALNAKSELGKNLDSLSDIVSFGVAPMALLVLKYQSAWVIGSSFILLACGAYRLARYNTSSSTTSFTGVPITINGIVFPVVIIANLLAAFVVPIILIMAWLMVSRLRVRKL